MALIIRLKNEILESQDEPEGDDVCNQHSAEVILFPGVRYERWSDAPSEPVTQREIHDRNAMQTSDRDWLEI